MSEQLSRAAILPLFAAGFLWGGMAAPVRADDASAWDNDIRSSARLIAARAIGTQQDRVLRAGIEIKLQPGWKTYWRYPGDSGVPPAFDFAASYNVKAVSVLFPAPMRFPDGAGGQSIGYRDNVILPLHIVAQDATKPVTLRLKLDYAACEKLCVPAKAKAELAISGAPSAHDDVLAAAEARVPKKVAVAAGPTPFVLAGGPPLSISTVRREGGSGQPRVIVDVAVTHGATPDLFVEGPTSDWALPLPRPVPGAPSGLHRFAFDLDGLPPGANSAGAMLRLTAVSGAEAIEATYRLD